ncbi:MAG TPA: class I SAM-dependent RNA methyltransferase, partial [Candidatus Aenigmarchaeota archaeon]|nr:class I SAM-dependent RNA methyltransferase [Candidatus Aenigmarchaeota archaeon]
MQFYITTVPGIEDLSAREIEGFGGKIREIRKNTGRVFFTGSEKLVAELNFYSRMIERVMVLLVKKEFGGLDDIYSIVRGIDFTFIPEHCSFAVRSMRVGSHGFTSIDVAKIAGQAIIDSYLQSKRK